MIRKATVQIKKSATSSTSTKISTPTNTTKEHTFDIEQTLQAVRDGFKDNRMTLLGFVFVLLSLIQLRGLILGIILLTSGILLISGFFSKK